jgi:homoserine dehydrogenase
MRWSVIRNLEEYYDNDLPLYPGNCDGSTNFILTKMFEENSFQ